VVAYLTRVAACLQVLFTLTAETLGKTTSFIKRQRKLTASAFAQTLVFQWMARPKATLESMALELDVSPQALQQHLGPEAEAFLLALLREALSKALKVPPQALGLLDRFGSAIIEDTTVVKLPPLLADRFPSCGGGTGAGEGAAALKALIRWNLVTGELLALTVHAGRTSDQTLAAAAGDLPQRCLHLADMGFFNTQRWLAYGAEQFWISRVPTRTQVLWQGAWHALGTVLGHVTEAVFDENVQLVGTTGLPCRLVVRRCPEEVANRRRQKLREYTRRKKGREPSVEQLELCAWLVYATNVPVALLSVKEVWVVYRCRWQIELLFKRAKQLAGWGFSWGRSSVRILVELHAKMLGLVVLHWGTLLGGGPLSGVSSWKRVKAVQDIAQRLQDSLAHGPEAVADVLANLAKRLSRIRPYAKSRKKPGTRQLLFKPGLAA
jgi:Transposase DDE domain